MKRGQRAIALDSGFANAFAGVARVYLTGFQLNINNLPEAESYNRVKWAAERARMRYERREVRLQSQRSTARTGPTRESGVKERAVQRALARARERLAQRKFSEGQ